MCITLFRKIGYLSGILFQPNSTIGQARRERSIKLHCFLMENHSDRQLVVGESVYKQVNIDPWKTRVLINYKWLSLQRRKRFVNVSYFEVTLAFTDLKSDKYAILPVSNIVSKLEVYSCNAFFFYIGTRNLISSRNKKIKKEKVIELLW